MLNEIYSLVDGYPMKVYGYDIQGDVSTISYHLDQNKMNKEVVK